MAKYRGFLPQRFESVVSEVSEVESYQHETEDLPIVPILVIAALATAGMVYAARIIRNP